MQALWEFSLFSSFSLGEEEIQPSGDCVDTARAYTLE